MTEPACPAIGRSSIHRARDGDRQERSGSRPAAEARAHHPGLDGAVRRASRRFERFRQGDGGINRQAGSTGLGLAIAKDLVEMHKGRIEVLDSDLGGARFEVTIPLNRLAAGADASATAASLDRTMVDGRRTMNSLPRPRPSLCTDTDPPCRSIRLRTIDSPSPNPPCDRSIA